jgi:hypothetical protein
MDYMLIIVVICASMLVASVVYLAESTPNPASSYCISKGFVDGFVFEYDPWYIKPAYVASHYVREHLCREFNPDTRFYCLDNKSVGWCVE